MKPLVSYVGSKGRIINDIDRLLPKHIDRYFEPFLGGGSVLFHLATNHPQITQYYVNDLEPKLMQLYSTVRNDITNFIKLLELLDQPNNKSKESFFAVLDAYNHEKVDKTTRSALYYYLLKLSFNSNLKYDANGTLKPTYSASHAQCKILNKSNIMDIHHFFCNQVDLYNERYQSFMKRFKFKEGDFVFLDPPYKVDLVKQYYTNDFSDKDYQELYDVCASLDRTGAKWMMTLDDHPFHKKLFKKYRIKRVKRHSYISNGKNVEHELIIMNY
jgi:DNA adenine methylase